MEKIVFEISRKDIDLMSDHTLTDEQWQELRGIVYEEARFTAFELVKEYLSELE